MKRSDYHWEIADEELVEMGNFELTNLNRRAQQWWRAFGPSALLTYSRSPVRRASVFGITFDSSKWTGRN